MKERQWFEVDWAEAQRSRKTRMHKTENAPGREAKRALPAGKQPGTKLREIYLNRRICGIVEVMREIWEWIWNWFGKYIEREIRLLDCHVST